MTHKLFHCWDCGTKVISNENNRYKPLPALEQVRFRLTDGSYIVSPFCDACAVKPWPAERLEDFGRAIQGIMPGFNPARLKTCEGPVDLIAGVAR